MTAQILSGKQLSVEIEKALQLKIANITATGERAPKLAVVLVGDHPASSIYVRHKQEMCERVGIISGKYDLPDTVSEKALLDLIIELNQNITIDGILVQMPLPAHISKEKIIEHIQPQKDVDGFHPYNMGKLAQGHPWLRPCTPYGIIRLLEHYRISPKGLHAVVVGASTIVGRPLALELLLASATVTVCHSKTRELSKHIQLADIVISATGKRDLIHSDWIKKEAIVIDVGIHRREDGSICGDLDFESASQRASFITPVPGGVGPMTVAMLMENTLKAFILSREDTL